MRDDTRVETAAAPEDPALDELRRERCAGERVRPAAGLADDAERLELDHGQIVYVRPTRHTTFSAEASPAPSRCVGKEDTPGLG
jgi:hypothetical protein